MRRRGLVMLVAVAFAFLAILVRLADIQVFTPSRYTDYARLQDTHTTVVPALRGTILDRSGRALALSQLRSNIIADDYQISDPAGEATALAAVLRLPAASLQSKLREVSGFVYLDQGVPTATGLKVSDLALPGITVEESPVRFYPAGQLALPVLGAVDASGAGAAGLEYAYNKVLSGTPGRLVQEVDPQGQPIAGGTLEDIPAVYGDDLILSLDEPLQYQTEQALAQALVAARASSGIAMVMNVRTGGLLAVADLSLPSGTTASPPALPVTVGSRGALLPPGRQASNPQPVESASAQAFTQVYEPGSLEKLVTVSAALATGAATPGQTFTIPNAYMVDGTSIHDAENHGTEKLSLTGIVAQSSNIGAAQVVQRLGAPSLYHYLNLFGIGAPTAVRFPGESAGLIPPLAHISPVRLATMAYGEGMAVTAAQMISAYNAIANGGVYVPPHLVKAIVGPGGHEHPVPHPPAHRIVPKSVAGEMTSILEQVVSAGTGTPAQVGGYAVAGKTGTAQLDGPHGYVAGRTVASFAGFVPAQQPAITIMVTVYDTGDYGAQAAAPAFAAIARDALADLRIPPYGPQPPASPSALPEALPGGTTQNAPAG